MNKISKIFDKKIFLYTFLIWLNLNISGIQKIYFSGGETLIIIIVKILHLFFLYAIFAKLHSLYVQRHMPKVKQEIVISLIYFLILGLFLILVWPGTWSSDDISILRNAEWYVLTPWQHFFSGLFQILCLQTIPIPSGVMIVQIIIVSLIVGYCISNISNLYGKNKKQVKIIQIVLGFITLLPPLIIYILSGFRMGMYSYFELALITKIIILHKEQKQITFNEILKISFLTIIISCWRTEAIYYPFFILILYFILGKKVIRKKVAIIAFLIIMLINFSIGKLNNVMLETDDYGYNPEMQYNGYNSTADKANNYNISATMEPVTALIKSSDKSDQEEIEKINKVLDVEFILEHPSYSGETHFWLEGVVKDYSEEEYNDYLKAYLKLALKYPDVTFKSMWNIFVKAGSGVGQNSKQTTRNMVSWNETQNLFDIESKTCRKWNAVTSRVEKYKKAINIDVRNAVITFLSGNDSNYNLTIIHNIFWNLFIPFTLILICLIYKLIKKDWFMVFLILTVIARIPIVFATAPAEYFMYYLSTYLCSYIISAIVILEIIINKREDNNQTGFGRDINKLFNKKIFLYTFFVWFILNTSGIQNIYFSEDKTFMAMIVNVLHFAFLYIIFAKLHSLYTQRHIPKVKNEIIISLIYFLILILLLFLVWPGAWGYDDITILKNASTYELASGDHFFSGIFQILCLQTIPIPSGVMIMQIIIASLIVGYCIANISTLYGKNKKQIRILQIVLGLITLFPPLVIYILSGLKMGIYSYLELALIIQMLILYKKQKDATLNDILKISFLTIIISCWTIEGIFYPFFILILYFILGKKIISRKVAITSFLIIILINFSIGKINKCIIETKEVITNNSLKNMCDIFVKAGSGLGEDSKQTSKNVVANTDSNTLELYSVNTKTWIKWNAVTSRVSDYKKPIDINIRNNVILFLNGSDSNGNLKIVHNIFWNLFIPFTLIFICLIYKFIKKDWFMVFLILTVIARISIVFVTATEEYFMYYLSAYLCSYIISAIVIFNFINNLMNKEKKDKQANDNKELIIYKQRGKEKIKKILKQFLSFLLVSGVGWIIDFSIYFVLTHFVNFKVVFANILSSIPAITYVFLMSNKGIFKNTNSKLSLKIKYLIYFGYQLILLFSVSLLGEFLYDKLINVIILPVLLNNLKIVIKILITPITMTMNFIVMKNLIEKL